MKKRASLIATVVGITVAVANAWLTIDWKEFDFEKEWPKLACSAVIAIGGIVSKVNVPEK